MASLKRDRGAGGLLPLDAGESTIPLFFLYSILPQRHHDTIDLQGDDGSAWWTVLLTPDPRESLIFDILPQSSRCLLKTHQACDAGTYAALLTKHLDAIAWRQGAQEMQGDTPGTGCPESLGQSGSEITREQRWHAPAPIAGSHGLDDTE